MSDILNYYKNEYHKTGYKMSNSEETSRVAFLKEFVVNFTPPKGRVLDVGCGDMHLSNALPGYDWVGLDIDTHTPNKPITVHDLMVAPYPFPDHSFDTVVCSEVLEHVWDLRVVHKEIKRLLKPGGTYIMSTPNYDHIDFFVSHYQQLLFDPNQAHLFEHIRQYNYFSHMRFLTEAGFKEITHVGADAQYSGMLQTARSALSKTFPELSMTKVDQIIGTMFPEFSHTIMIVSKS